MHTNPYHPYMQKQVVDALEKQFGFKDWFEYVEIVNKLRGFQCGCKYAEAFRVVKTWPNQKTTRLLPPV